MAELVEARRQLSGDASQGLVLRIARTDLADHLDAYVTKHRLLVVESLETWWDKYAVTLRTIEAERREAAAALAGFLKTLGYE